MATLLAKDLMSTHPLTVHEKDDVDSVYELMLENNIRHVPVLDACDRVSGVLSQRDLARKVLYAEDSVPWQDVREILQALSAKNLMSKPALCIGPDLPAIEAGHLLLKHKFGCLPVTEEGRLVGILTEADFVRHTVEQGAREQDFSAKGQAERIPLQ